MKTISPLTRKKPRLKMDKNRVKRSFLFTCGFFIGLRFLYFYLNQDGQGHIQSLILCAIVLTLSFVCFMLAIIGDLFSINRKILEDIQFEIRQNKYKK